MDHKSHSEVACHDFALIFSFLATKNQQFGPFGPNHNKQVSSSNPKSKFGLWPSSFPTQQTAMYLFKHSFHCFECKRVFRLESQLEQHSRQIQPTTTSTTTTANDTTIIIELEDAGDAHPHESPACTAQHTHDPVDKYFPLMKDAKDWLESQELDTAFRTRDSRPNYAKFTCRHRRVGSKSKYEVKGQRKRQDVVANLECHAQFVIKKSVVCQCARDNPDHVCTRARTMFRLRGCLMHAHERQVRSLRIPQVTRNLIIGLLKDGVPNQTILRCATTNRINMYDKIVTMQDIRNIAKRYAAQSKNSVKREPESTWDDRTRLDGLAIDVGRKHERVKVELHVEREEKADTVRLDEQMEAEDERQRLMVLEERRLTALQGLRDCVRFLEDDRSSLLDKEDLISQVEDLVAQRKHYRR